MLKPISELKNEEFTYYGGVKVLFEGQEKPTEYFYETTNVEITERNGLHINLTDYYAGILYFYADGRKTKRIYYSSESYLPPITHYELYERDSEDDEDEI